MTHIHFNAMFTTDEQIEYLEKSGWKIEKKEKSVWIQTGPYDRVGEVEHQIRYYASKPNSDPEEIDRVFKREVENRLKAFILKFQYVEYAIESEYP
jgi:hypothetical protein